MNTKTSPRLYASLPILSGAHCRAVIDLQALRHNFRTLRARAGGADSICVVKADAYGHGAAALVRALYAEGCRFFAVSCIEEAIAVREVAQDAEILIFGNLLPCHTEALARYRLTATVFSSSIARELSDEATRLGVRLRVHIKIDTGMNRLGFPVCQESARYESEKEIESLFSMKGLCVTGIYSHFATADEPDGRDTHRQAARFFSVTEALENKGFSLGVKHICNSAGLLGFPEYAADAVRFGLALYGYLPRETEDVTLKPVMRLESEVMHLHTMPAHERVGYGGAFGADEPRQIATVGIGYADGWLRAYTGAQVTVHTESGEVKATVVGRICMDQCMLDVTGLSVKRGDRVTLFGKDPLELEALSTRAGTIPYESLCLISSRVPREIEDGSITC